MASTELGYRGLKAVPDSNISSLVSSLSSAYAGDGPGQRTKDCDKAPIFLRICTSELLGPTPLISLPVSPPSANATAVAPASSTGSFPASTTGPSQLPTTPAPTTAVSTSPDPGSSSGSPVLSPGTMQTSNVSETGSDQASDPITSATTFASQSSAEPPGSSATSNVDLAPSSAISSTAIPPTALSLSRAHTDVGAIAGGVVGGVLFVVIVLLLLLFHKPLMKYYHQRVRNKRVAPSSEFLNTPSHLFHSQSRLAMTSPVPVSARGHYRGNSALSVRGIRADLVGSPDDNEQPPPFTPGTFNDPVIEKVAAAAQQREMFLQTHVDNQHEGTSDEGSILYNPYVLPDPLEHSLNYPPDTFDWPATSPILSSESHEAVAGPSSSYGHGASRSPRSTEEAGWAV